MSSAVHTTIRGTFSGMSGQQARGFLFAQWQNLQALFRDDPDLQPYCSASLAFPDLRKDQASALKLKVAASRVPEHADSEAFVAFDGETYEIADCGPAGELALAMVLLAREHDGWDAVISCQAPPGFRRSAVDLAKLIQPDLPAAEWMVATNSLFHDPVSVPEHLDYRA